MIRKLKSGEYRLYSRKKNPKTGKRRNLGTFSVWKRPRPMSAQCSTSNAIKGENMPSEKQRSAARKNIKKAASAARKKRTIAHLAKATRTALGKQAAKVAKQKRRKKAA